MRVLVTGAAGRLGRSVVDGLARDHRVVAVDRVEPPCADGVTPVRADLSDDGLLAELLARHRPEAVVHLAGIAVPFSRPEAEIFSLNTSLAWRVMEGALLAGARTVLVASSPTVIGYGAPHGWTPRYLPLDEDHPVEPWNAYAASKVALEEAMRTLARAHPQSWLGAVRPCYVITPEEWTGEPTQQGHTVADRLEKPELAAPSLFNYVDARDAAELFRLMLDRPGAIPSGATFFCGAADALATRPLARLVPEFHPGAAAAARPLGGTSPAFSTEKAGRLLGWRPRRSWRTELG